MKQENLNKIVQLRHALHRHPELSLQENETKERILRFLKKYTSTLEFETRDGWFCAVKRGSDPDADEKSAAFRADMDALPIDEEAAGSGTPVHSEITWLSEHPGISHKCGHDGHCAALCGLALELDQAECRRTVWLIFQPGEEIGAGGKMCAGLIREKGIREIYAFHNLSGYPQGQIVYRRGLTQPASEGLEIRFQGKQSHASEPENGVNPAETAAAVVLSIRQLLDRRKMPDGLQKPAEDQQGMLLCTITGIKVGTGDFGISPGEGIIRLTLRAEHEEEMKLLERSILAMAEEQAKTAGLQISHQIFDYFPETRNSGEGISRILDAAEKLQIPAQEMPEIWRASEDFGWYLKECPGAMFYIGNGEEWPALHTKEYDFNDRILERAVEIFLKLAAE